MKSPIYAASRFLELILENFSLYKILVYSKNIIFSIFSVYFASTEHLMNTALFLNILKFQFLNGNLNYSNRDLNYLTRQL